MTVDLNLSRHGDPKAELALQFQKAEPFPNIVIDNFLEQADAERLLTEHEAIGNGDGWGAYVHYNERKSGLTKFERMGHHTRDVITALSGPEFLNWLQEVSGIDELMADPDLDGGGLHKIERNGYLNVHVDFLAHTTRPTWSRQLNLLLYLNKDWNPAWNGALELWDADMTECVKSVEPVFNRCVIFNTRKKSFHGHPTPLCCPEDRARRSLALYYFRDENEALSLEPTYYRARPDEPAWKHALVWADRKALWVYSALKRHLGLKEGFVQNILRRF